MANTLPPYPTDVTEPSKIVLMRFQGKPTNRNELVHASVELQRYAVGVMYPDNGSDPTPSPTPPAPLPMMNASNFHCPCPDNDECCAILAKCHAPSDGKMQGIFDRAFAKKLWAIALKVLMELAMNPPVTV